MTEKALVGYIIEEKTEGVDYWFRANGYIYDDDLSAYDYADRRSRVRGVEKTRVLEMKYFKPEVKVTFPTEFKERN